MLLDRSMDNDSGKPQIAIGRVPCRPEVNVRSVEEDIIRCTVR